MKTYFLQFEVIPTPNNEHFKLTEGALVACWILENNSEAAYGKAVLQVSKYDWNIINIETPPLEVTEEHFIGKDIGIEQYMKAQEKGSAFYYLAWARDKKSSVGPMTIKSSYRPNIAAFLNKQKQLSRRGRCLHYDHGNACKEIINAHSIQKKQALSSISQNGYVYTLSSNMSTLTRNKGIPRYEKNGIGTVSTFLGFCSKHDNELFEPIDNFPLHPTEHQAFLYAYRSLCREMFVKENALDFLESRARSIDIYNPIKDHFDALKLGTKYGLNILKTHKSIYDESLKRKAYDDIRYVLFTSDHKPTMVFSGLLYPDFDFLGRHLQNLADHERHLELITFCSSPMTSSWGFLFAWHRTSSKVCNDFMASLATQIYNGHRVSDLLFRLVISGCENHAISPEWWESLPTNIQEQIVARFSLTLNPYSRIKPTYLSEGLEGISEWEFTSVISNMDSLSTNHYNQ